MSSAETRKSRLARKALFFLFILSLPCGFCSSVSLLELLPESYIPGYLSFMVNLFESTAAIENKTNEVLFVTPITTTRGHPEVIAQHGSILQRDFPIQPNESISLIYDSADFGLNGIVVCKASRQCKLLPADYSKNYIISSFESLSDPDASTLNAVEAYPQKSYALIFTVIFAFAPIVFFAGWAYFRRLEKKLKVDNGITE